MVFPHAEFSVWSLDHVLSRTTSKWFSFDFNEAFGVGVFLQRKCGFSKQDILVVLFVCAWVCWCLCFVCFFKYIIVSVALVDLESEFDSGCS